MIGGVIRLNMDIILRTIAILLTAAFAYLGAGFSRVVEPENFNLIAVLFFVVFGALLQLGLFLSTTRAGKKHRLLTSGFMMPCLLFLVAANFDMVSRFISGNPISAYASLVYILGLLTYIYAYLNLLRRKQP